MHARALLAVTATAAALFTATPSYATGVSLCPAGYVGVIVEDPSGQRATVCVYVQDVRDTAEAAVDEAIDKAEALRLWLLRDVPRFVRSCEVNEPGNPTIGECDEIPFPPL